MRVLTISALSITSRRFDYVLVQAQEENGEPTKLAAFTVLNKKHKQVSMLELDELSLPFEVRMITQTVAKPREDWDHAS